jgi:hypothetical protein
VGKRLLQRRLSNAAWPRSALVAELRHAGIPVEAVDLAATQLGIVVADGRWRLPGD